MSTRPAPERAERLRVILDGATNNAGWTRQKLGEWGVPWPPPRGWRDTIIQHGFPYRHDLNTRAKKRARRPADQAD